MSQSMMALNLSIFPPASIKIIILFKFWNNINSLYHIMQHLLSLGVNLKSNILLQFFLFKYTFFFYKQLGSDLSLQSCMRFSGFGGSTLLSSCLVVCPSNLCLRGIQQFSGLKIDIYDQ